MPMHALPFSGEHIVTAQKSAYMAARLFRLPLRSLLQHGHSGSVLGSASGSSLEYQDHRSYVYGDEPRHIDWQAYARTETLVMKVFREEVTPKVDLIVDASSSMFLDEVKSIRSAELLFFICESAEQAQASLRIQICQGEEMHTLEREQCETFLKSLTTRATSVSAPDVSRVRLRAQSLRVFLSDLLFPNLPSAYFSRLAVGAGKLLVFAPFCKAEAQPEWNGAIDFEDCESLRQRRQDVTPHLLLQYQQAYARHFALWKAEALKYRALVTCVSADASFEEALTHEALSQGAIELCH